jgi:hypothetical protein
VFARLLAAFCLYTLAVVSACASEVVVYLRPGSLPQTRTLEVMKQELAPLMLSAGYQVEWRESPHDTDASSLVVLELRGTCAAPAGAIPLQALDAKDLASSATSAGAVLPFSSINCDGLTRMLAPALSAEAPARRDFLYGRAMARLMAHELYHILANTRDHERSGIAKPHFSLADLTGESLDFDRGALTKLGISAETASQ